VRLLPSSSSFACLSRASSADLLPPLLPQVLDYFVLRLRVIAEKRRRCAVAPRLADASAAPTTCRPVDRCTRSPLSPFVQQTRPRASKNRPRPRRLARAPPFSTRRRLPRLLPRLLPLLLSPSPLAAALVPPLLVSAPQHVMDALYGRDVAPERAARSWCVLPPALSPSR